MGVLPATGTEITMGKVAKALGFMGVSTYPPPAGSNIKLNDGIGDIIGIAPNAETKLSEDFGGLTSPNDYP